MQGQADLKNIISTFLSLITDKYIERCPPCILPKPFSHLIWKRTDTGTIRKHKISKTDEAEIAAINSVHAIYQKDRFRIPEDMTIETIINMIKQNILKRK